MTTATAPSLPLLGWSAAGDPAGWANAYPSLRVPGIGVYMTRDGWPNNMSDLSTMSQFSNWLNKYPHGFIDLGVPMGPAGDDANDWGWIGNDATLTRIASGVYDAQYTAAFKAWLSYNRPIVARLGWEEQQQTQTMYTTPENPYTQAWRRLATLAWNVSPTLYIAGWCPNAKGNDPTNWYPGVQSNGKQWAQIAMIDLYEWSFDGGDALAEGLTGPFSLNWLIQFAKSKGIPWALGEWGCVAAGYNNGKGDDPAWVAEIFNTMRNNGGLYGCYYGNAAGVNMTPGKATLDALAVNFGGIVEANPPLPLTAVVTPTPTPTPTPAPTPTLPICRAYGRSTSFKDETGQVWQPEVAAYFTDGGGGITTAQSLGHAPGQVTNTKTPTLYDVQRWGITDINEPVPNGMLQVTLKFADINVSSGPRTFDISMEGLLEKSNYQIAGGVGNKADDQTFLVLVQDGILSIHFTKGQNLSTVTALMVTAAPKPTIVPSSAMPQIDLSLATDAKPYTGKNAQALQALLVGYGYGSMPVDGKAGTATRTALGKAQLVGGLTQDYIAGPNTWGWLLNR